MTTDDVDGGGDGVGGNDDYADGVKSFFLWFTTYLLY